MRHFSVAPSTTFDALGSSHKSDVGRHSQVLRDAPRHRSVEASALPIDIDKLTETELIDLNNRVVARMTLLHQMCAHAHMIEFSLGERVSFRPEVRAPLAGVIAKYNRKSVTVFESNGQQWNVSPVFLLKAESSGQTKPGSTRLLTLPGK